VVPARPINDKARDFIRKYLNVDLPDAAADKRLHLESAADDEMIARLRGTRGDWLRAREGAVKDIARLKITIEQQFEGLDEFRAEVDGALRKLDQAIQRFDTALDGQLDAILNEPAQDRRQDLAKAARQTVAVLASYVETDPVMAQLDGNEVLPDIAIAGPIRSALTTISAALG
jgi:Rad3-related DNA helicase